MVNAATRFAAAYAALHASHAVGDHIVQSDRDACTKADPTLAGKIACGRHCLTYAATQLAALVAVNAATGARLRPGRIAAGLAVSAISHYVIDRRTVLKRFADATGKGRFYRLGTPQDGDGGGRPCLGTGAYALDQSAHTGFLLLAALVIGGGER